jgi:hypothetical protein
MSRTGTDGRIPKGVLIAAALLTMAFPRGATADDYDPPGRVARLRYVQGPVSLQPAGDSDWVSAVVNRPTTTGDRLWTNSGARAELSIGSATIRLAGTTGFSFLNLDDRTVQIELTQGTLGIRVRRLGRDEVFEVDTPNQAFTILRPGRYRIEASENGYTTFVTVRDGEGEAAGTDQTYPVRSGESATFTGMDSLRADIAGAGPPDEFDSWAWSRDRRDDRSRSARYVSRGVVGYEDLDDYGSWRSDPRYGYIWFPRGVAYGWAPYREGHWAWISPWGWTWVDDEPWGYAPFHYGRWVYLGGIWGWVPGPVAIQPVYAPALVAFVGGPGFGVSVSVRGGGYGNVGWFPLGPGEVYVPAYQVSPVYVNRVNVSNTIVTSTTITTVYNTQVTNNYSTTNITYVNRTVPGGVTAVPHGVFTSAQPVARAAVAVNVQQVASAPVDARVAVAPTRQSVLGVHASTAGTAPRPPAAIASRPVVAKAPPPPPPVPFARQQEALAAHPGQPLARHEVEQLRSGERAAVQPRVRQVTPGRPATPEMSRPATQPGAVRPGQPAAAQPPSAPPGKPQELRPQPPSAQPSAQPQKGERPGAAGQGQPARPQPPSAPPGKPQELRPQPPSAQPSAEPQRGERPGAAGQGQPARPQPPSAPPGKPQELRPDRPPSAQPNRQPAPAADAPRRAGPQGDRPQPPKPQAAPHQNPPQTETERARKEQENQ